MDFDRANDTDMHMRCIELEIRIQIDMEIYPIQQCDKILGILSGMVKQEA